MDFNEFVPKVHFELIPIDELVCDQEYQRALSAAHIKRIVDNFDVYQINPVKISRREGLNRVFNGQHTIESVANKSGSRKTPVWCMIYDDLTYEEEAYIFANQQKYNRALLPYEIYVANLEAGNGDELMIRDLVKAYGLVVRGTKKPGGICAVSTLLFIYKNFGFPVLDRTMRLVIGTWEGDPVSLSAAILRGVAFLVVAYGDALKDETFKEKIGEFTARDISRNAKERRRGTIGFAETMLDEYNSKRKNGLQWTKLRDLMSEIRKNGYVNLNDGGNGCEWRNKKDS